MLINWLWLKGLRPCSSRQFFQQLVMQRLWEVSYRGNSVCNIPLCNWLRKEIAEKIEQSSLFKRLRSELQRANICWATCFATGMSNLTLAANNRVLSNFIAGKKDLHCKLRKEFFTSEISLATYSFSLCR